MSAPTNDAAFPSAEAPEVRRISLTEARALLDAGRGVLVDVRDRRLYDNAHAAGAISLPLAAVEAMDGRIPPGVLPPDRVAILYCA